MSDRVNVGISSTIAKKVKKSAKSQHTSQKTFITNAIATYLYLTNEVQNNSSQVFIKTKDGENKEIIFNDLIK